MSFLKKIFGDENAKALKKIQPLIEKINSLEEEIQKLPPEAFPQRTADFRARLEAGETEDDILPEAFALVREAAKRTLGERHYDVQLIGGIVLHQGKISEMRTGEGKTLVATLPAYLNALSGKGVHVVTVNDYLARRDAVWMGQVFSYLGVSVAVINHEASYLYDPKHQESDEERDELGSFKVIYDFLRPCSRQDAYLADITYGTNSEFGFDYLRDNIAYAPQQLTQRGYHYALVDEIDSILIDEARTPLIISSTTIDSEDLYITFAGIARNLNETEDYEVDEKLKAVTLTDL
ncbi:MAG: hypothetical protein NT098_02660 [Candidatus Parcubacteria bacterium]|nr:hypothetical protein [Candidatus Parcubacteria bacterium]